MYYDEMIEVKIFDYELDQDELLGFIESWDLVKYLPNPSLGTTFRPVKKRQCNQVLASKYIRKYNASKTLASSFLAVPQEVTVVYKSEIKTLHVTESTTFEEIVGQLAIENNREVEVLYHGKTILIDSRVVEICKGSACPEVELIPIQIWK